MGYLEDHVQYLGGFTGGRVRTAMSRFREKKRSNMRPEAESNLERLSCCACCGSTSCTLEEEP